MNKINIRKIFKDNGKKTTPTKPEKDHAFLSAQEKLDREAEAVAASVASVNPQPATLGFGESAPIANQGDKKDAAEKAKEEKAQKVAKKLADKKAAKEKKEQEKKDKLSKKDKYGKTGKKGMPKMFFLRLSVKEQTHFMKRMAFLVRSGVPVLESLHILRGQFRSRSKGAMMDAIIDSVANGKTLSAALAKFDKVFGAFSINIIKVGEMSGNLADNLAYLADELKKRQALRRKVIGALVYPAFITVATIGIATLLTVYIFPKIMPIFISLNVHLPLTTRILLWTSDFLRHSGLYLFGAIIVLSIGMTIAIRKIPKFHYFIARTILRLPLLGTLVQSYNVTNFCRTLGLLLKSGFNVVEALTVTADATANPVYKGECKKLEVEIIRGQKISTHLSSTKKLFPDMVTHMILIGETSGNLTDTLLYLSEHYEAELDDLIKNLSSSIEPVLMIFMGLLVGFVAVSVITPIYEITQNLQPR